MCRVLERETQESMNKITSCCDITEITLTAALTLSILLITQEAVVDSVDQDQMAQNMHSELC